MVRKVLVLKLLAPRSEMNGNQALQMGGVAWPEDVGKSSSHHRLRLRRSCVVDRRPQPR